MVSTLVKLSRHFVHAPIFSEEPERGYIELPGGIIELLGLGKASV